MKSKSGLGSKFQMVVAQATGLTPPLTQSALRRKSIFGSPRTNPGPTDFGNFVNEEFANAGHPTEEDKADADQLIKSYDGIRRASCVPAPPQGTQALAETEIARLRGIMSQMEKTMEVHQRLLRKKDDNLATLMRKEQVLISRHKQKVSEMQELLELSQNDAEAVKLKMIQKNAIKTKESVVSDQSSKMKQDKLEQQLIEVTIENETLSREYSAAHRQVARLQSRVQELELSLLAQEKEHAQKAEAARLALFSGPAGVVTAAQNNIPAKLRLARDKVQMLRVHLKHMREVTLMDIEMANVGLTEIVTSQVMERAREMERLPVPLIIELMEACCDLRVNLRSAMPPEKTDTLPDLASPADFCFESNPITVFDTLPDVTRLVTISHQVVDDLCSDLRVRKKQLEENSSIFVNLALVLNALAGGLKQADEITASTAVSTCRLACDMLSAATETKGDDGSPDTTSAAPDNKIVADLHRKLMISEERAAKMEGLIAKMSALNTLQREKEEREKREKEAEENRITTNPPKAYVEVQFERIAKQAREIFTRPPSGKVKNSMIAMVGMSVRVRYLMRSIANFLVAKLKDGHTPLFAPATQVMVQRILTQSSKNEDRRRELQRREITNPTPSSPSSPPPRTSGAIPIPRTMISAVFAQKQKRNIFNKGTQYEAPKAPPPTIKKVDIFASPRGAFSKDLEEDPDGDEDFVRTWREQMQIRGSRFMKNGTIRGPPQTQGTTHNVIHYSMQVMDDATTATPKRIGSRPVSSGVVISEFPRVAMSIVARAEVQTASVKKSPPAPPSLGMCGVWQRRDPIVETVVTPPAPLNPERLAILATATKPPQRPPPHSARTPPGPPRSIFRDAPAQSVIEDYLHRIQTGKGAIM